MKEKWYKRLLNKIKAGFKRIGKMIFETVHKVVEFTEKYPKETAILVVGMGTATRFLRKILRAASKDRRADRETYEKQTRVWDPAERHYWHLTRPLTDDEWRYVEKMRAEKYGYSYILTKLGVLM